MKNFTSRLRIAAAIAILFASASSAIAKQYSLRKGDILFKQVNSDDFSDAVTAATRSVDGYQFSHVAIIVDGKDDNAIVEEAVFSGVKLTPIKEFFEKEDSCVVVVMRLKEPYRRAIDPAIARIKKLLGKEYDREFLPYNDKYYCSELIESNFILDGRPVFQRERITFKDKASGETSPLWISYFNELGKPIPEGVAGSSPGGLSKSPALETIHVYTYSKQQ